MTTYYSKIFLIVRCCKLFLIFDELGIPQARGIHNTYNLKTPSCISDSYCTANVKDRFYSYAMWAAPDERMNKKYYI